ncbi:hypothetical protein BCR35DRAFT_302041 [Leucosporidium creatinivorum]|uniref:Uncharacterized protein n=1 Tax=Leucosporidium creatinivorum TaxID=106004 RepID=A0A1Y2FVU5_9BASI|nr:hypothetical protein BCR35DRAFT_302041 [Leucosporidium creatinivorum]
MSTAALPTPSKDELDELLLCARYGDDSDLDDIKAFIAKFGDKWLAEAKDDRGNTCLHLAGANGHEAIVAYLLPLLPATALIAPNEAQSTPLHWMSLNYHLSVLRLLCPLLPISAFSIPNGKGKTAVQEAEEACEAFIVNEEEQNTPRGKERVRREVVVGYLLQSMGLGVKEATTKEGAAEEEAGAEGEGDVVVAAGENKETLDRLAQEAEKMKISGQAP